ncbi:MAG: fasciclin domain-containing protein [Planctomycetota bacterium]|nr:fasciclin domain-containing protein [Planctomycetota bacterium]
MKGTSILSVAALVAVAGIAIAGSEPAKAPTKAPDATKTAADTGAPTKDIVATAVAAGNFKTLATALQATGLVEALQAPGPFTVFAPTDEAFAKLPAGTLEELLKPENKDKLASILKFHVLPGAVLSRDVARMKESSATLQGSSFRIEVKDGKVMIGTDPKLMANVTTVDIKATNGVIHVIDRVILPRQ